MKRTTPSLLQLSATSGRVSVAAEVRAFGGSSRSAVDRVAGFSIEEATLHDVAYPVVTVTAEPGDEDPPDLVIGMIYDQEEAFKEVDLNVKWENMPPKTAIAVDSTFATFSIAKTQVGTSTGSTGKIAKGNEPIRGTLTLRVWFDDPTQVDPDARFIVNTTTPAPTGREGPTVPRISSLGGPTPMRLLGQVALKPRT